MLTGNQTKIQSQIEFSVSNGLGFNKTHYLSKNSFYKGYLFEDEIKNTNAGLQAHLAEMNFDRELNKYFDVSKKKFLGKIRAGFYYGSLCLKYQNLKDKAINEAVENRGGLFNLILERKIIRDNIIHFITNPEMINSSK